MCESNFLWHVVYLNHVKKRKVNISSIKLLIHGIWGIDRLVVWSCPRVVELSHLENPADLKRRGFSLYSSDRQRVLELNDYWLLAQCQVVARLCFCGKKRCNGFVFRICDQTYHPLYVTGAAQAPDSALSGWHQTSAGLPSEPCGVVAEAVNQWLLGD